MLDERGRMAAAPVAEPVRLLRPLPPRRNVINGLTKDLTDRKRFLLAMAVQI
jgi:hypothetical protein